MNSIASVHPELPVCHSERSEESLPNRETTRFFVAPFLRMTFQFVISGWRLAHKIRFTLPFQCVCCLFLLVSLVSCGKPELKKNSPEEVLLAPGFRLLDSPQEVVPWRYHYPNRAFNIPSYRNPQGTPLPGWHYEVVATRRFFTNQSARIYYRIEDLRQSYLFSSTSRAGAEMMRIWPVGTVLVLETFSGGGALIPEATPLFVDCLRKFEPNASHFPVDTLFAGDWCYQRFSATGKVRSMPAGASACHQCHGTALHLTGDLVFTLFSQDDAVLKD